MRLIKPSNLIHLAALSEDAPMAIVHSGHHTSRTYYNGLYMADKIQELLAFSNENVKCFDDDCA